MKQLIVNKDQKIQERLKALHDLKDTMTQPIHSVGQMGLQSKDSFNQTKIITKQFDNISQLNWNSENQCLSNINTENDEKFDPELSQLRKKYQEDDSQSMNGDLNVSKNVRNYDHYRNNSQVYEAPPEDRFSYRSQLNKSHEIGIHYRKQSQQTNDKVSDRQTYLGRMMRNQIQSPKYDQEQQNNDHQETCTTEEGVPETVKNNKPNSYNIYSKNIPPKPKTSLRFPVFSLEQTHMKDEQNLINQGSHQDIGGAITDIVSHISNRTSVTQSDVTMPRQEFFSNHKKLSSQELKGQIQYSQPSNIHGITELYPVKEELNEIKGYQRDQSCILNKIQTRLDRQESDVAKQISKSVERITTELESLKHQLAQQKMEEDNKYDSLYKDIKDIKHYCKKRSKRHSKKQLERNQSQLTAGGQRLTNYQSQDKLTFHSGDYSSNRYLPQVFNHASQDLNQQDVYNRSANFGCIPTTNNTQQSNVKTNQQEKYQSQYAQSQNLGQNNINDNYKVTPTQMMPTQHSDQQHQRYYYDFQTLNQNQTTRGYDQTKQYSENKPIIDQNNGHTISFNTEIEKVREESQKNMNELKSFYEKQLSKMREEFENRESQLKEKMKIEIQESMVNERVKLNQQLQILERDKASLHHKLHTTHKSNSNNPYSGHESLASFVTENMTKNQTLNQDILSNDTQTLQYQSQPNQNQILQERKHYNNYVTNDSSNRKSDRKNSRRKIKEEKRIKENINPHNILLTGSYGAHPLKKKHSDKSSHLNMSIPNVRTYSTGQKESYNTTHYQLKASTLVNDDKLQIKEKEILRRINKIETFLNRAT